MNKIRLTQFEKECQEALALVQDWMSPGRRSNRDYLHLMGVINAAKKHLDYRELGCPMGEHMGECTCQENIRGESCYARKRKIKALIKLNAGKGSK